MERPEPFPADTPVVWRSRPNGDVGYVFACRVLADDPDLIAVVQPTGAPVVRRVAQRGGPRGRSVLPRTWDGSRQETRWDRPPVVRLHPVGRPYSVIRTWLAGEERFQGWYVNLEQPWIRTTLGFDSRDDVLDVTVSDDLSECLLKDEDELEFALEVGLFSWREVRSIRATAQSAVDDIVRRRWPFQESAWRDFRPPSYDQPPVLPAGWADP